MAVLYALTNDVSGRNLVLQTGTENWRFESSITLRRDKNSQKYKLIKATLAALAKHGYILTYSAIQPFPTSHHRGKMTASKE